MRNYRKVFAIVLVAGVLLGGLGAGVALAEYSSLEYVGRQVIGNTSMTTQEFTVEIPAKNTPENRLYLGSNYYHHDWSVERTIVQDETIPQGDIVVRISYNQNQGQPEVVLEEGDDSLAIYWYYNDSSSDMAQMFAVKDQLLEDLKNHKIGNYDTMEVESIQFLIHPNDRNRVIF